MSAPVPEISTEPSAPLRVRTVNELRYYLMVTGCPQCGKGPLQLAHAPPRCERFTRYALPVRCRACEAQREVEFICEFELPESGAGSETVNPKPAPSAVIDLAGWLSLFYLLAESASQAPDAVAARREGYRAGLCLAEALKFYGDDELPPETAFYAERSAAAFHEHPEGFAKERLLRMHAKLPSLDVMRRNIERDVLAPRPRWWQFWRRSS